MNKLVLLALGCACGSAGAQTPAANPMPDGSRDMYVGLGAQSAPRYAGTGSRKLSALPVLQVEWSNGLFVAGMSAGLHLSDAPTLEYGPLLAVLPGRDDSGVRSSIGSVSGSNAVVAAVTPATPAGQARIAGLRGMDPIATRLQAGAFANYYLSPQWRLTGTVLAGSGQDRDGVRLDLGVQRLAAVIGEHHQLSVAAGLDVVNRHDNASYFGVTRAEALRSRFAAYAPGGGLQDAYLGARWNWAWTPAWMLSSSLQARRLLGSADKSPLAERSTNVTVSTAIAFRF